MIFFSYSSLRFIYRGLIALKPISHARRSIYRAMEASENERFLEQTLNVKYFHECIICLSSAMCRKSPIILTIANIADKSYLDPRSYERFVTNGVPLPRVSSEPIE